MNNSILSRVKFASFYAISALCCFAMPGAAIAKDYSNMVTEANNAFALDLYGKLAPGNDGNLFFSPISIETALAMAYAGARGQTAGQMAAVLRLPPESGAIHKDFGAFIDGLNSAGRGTRGCEISAANALWGQTGFSFLPAFMGLLKTDYGAGLDQLDFQHNAEGARQTINTWVAKQTAGKITDLIGPGVLKPATRLVLTNAIYFKGTWSAPFKAAATHDAPFFLSTEKSTKVPMMARSGQYDCLETADFQALKLDYTGNGISMIIFLPWHIDGLAGLEKELTAANLADWFAKFAPNRVAVTIPKFKMTQNLELAPTLGALGMPDAFGPGADFSGMTGKRDLYISNVIHKAFVSVYEEGTEAAAATAVTMMSMAMMAPPPITFRADHPFLFVIREETSGAILFMGRLAEPN